MNAPMTKFAIMRANREKQRQIAAYGRIRDEIERAAVGDPGVYPKMWGGVNHKRQPWETAA